MLLPPQCRLMIAYPEHKYSVWIGILTVHLPADMDKQAYNESMSPAPPT